MVCRVESRTQNGGRRREKTILALILLDVSAVPLRDSGAREVATEHDHLWDEVVFDAVVEDVL